MSKIKTAAIWTGILGGGIAFFFLSFVLEDLMR